MSTVIVERRVELIFEGPRFSETVRLEKGSTFLGKGEESGIRIPDDVLEEKHIELDWDETELWLIHLGNGVRPMVNGELVAEANLRSGDRVELGEHAFKVRILRRTRPGAPEGRQGPSVARGPAPVAPAGPGEGEAAGPAPAPEAPPPPPSPDEQVLLEFTVHQLIEQPRKGMIVGVGAVLFFLVMWFWVIPGNVGLMLLAVIILLGAVGAFVFPLHYRITEAGVEIRGFPIRDRKRWSRFGSYVVYPDAVQLLLPQKDLRGRVLKGTLVFYGAHKDRILEIVAERVPKGYVAPPKGEKKARPIDAPAGASPGAQEEAQKDAQQGDEK